MKIDETGRSQTWTACADLSRARQFPVRPGHNTGWPAWSPDGARIAINADFDDPDPTSDPEIWDIYTTDRNGGAVRRLTRSTGLAGDPSYSPDGKLIAYDSNEQGKQGIWVMNAADGTDPRRVTPLPSTARTDYAPRFAPDGQRLVFTRVVSDSEAALWIVNLDGSGLRRITPETILADKSDWSHDGSTIVFNANTGGAEFSNVWVVEPDGQGLQNLTETPTEPPARDGYSKPVWSPDDGLILTTHGVHHADRMKLGLATMRRDGSDLRWVTDGTGFEKYPEWSSAPC